VGDTFHHEGKPVPPLPGFRPAKPMVFASVYPVDTGDFEALTTNVARLRLNDASVSCERESSSSLGLGLRCGFLGLLHMQVFIERLQQEFDTPVIITAPMVAYRLDMLDGTTLSVERVSDMPPAERVSVYHEPTAHVTIIAPASYVNALMAMLADRRGIQEDVVYLQSGAQAQAVAAGLGGAAAVGGAGVGMSGAGGALGAAAWVALPRSLQQTTRAAEMTMTPPTTRRRRRARMRTNEDEAAEAGEATGRSATPRAPAGSSVSVAAPSTTDRVVLKYTLPWAEVVTDLHDAIKSLTQGYASLDWLPGEYAAAPIVKVDMLVNGKAVDALSFVAHRDKAAAQGRRVAQRLKSVIARHQFEVVVQAAIGAKVFARERIAPYRKDVLTKSGKTVGGGDITRKRKLLEKQKEGKKRMKTLGSVALSQEAFHSVMARG
jgi:translation elongation factor EF-4